MSNPGQKSGRETDRSSFVNQLSQYLKEKRIGDLTTGGIAAKVEAKDFPATTMNLLPLMDNSESSRRNDGASTSNAMPSNCAPKISGPAEDEAKTTDSRKPEIAGASPLTIFFGGQVLVYNDFPAEKVKEIIALAGDIATGFVSDPQISAEKPNLNKSESHHVPDLNLASTSWSNSAAEQHSVDRTKDIGSVLPFAKRNSDLSQKSRSSLHRFFAKRKDRVKARAVPYEIQDRRGSPSPKPDEGILNSLDVEGQSSKEGLQDLDLNL